MRHMSSFLGAAIAVLVLLLGCNEAVVLVGEVSAPRGGNPPASIPVPPPPPPRDAGTMDAWEPPPAPLPCAGTADITANILTPKCGICHGQNMPANDLDLVSPGVRERLLGGRSPACAGKPFVTFVNGYVGGHLFDKLAGFVPGCGNQMPFGAIAPLSDFEVDCLKTWLRPADPPP